MGNHFIGVGCPHRSGQRRTVVACNAISCTMTLPWIHSSGRRVATVSRQPWSRSDKRYFHGQTGQGQEIDNLSRLRRPDWPLLQALGLQHNATGTFESPAVDRVQAAEHLSQVLEAIANPQQFPEVHPEAFLKHL